MSIIHEALKKAQADLEKQENHGLTKMYEDLHRPSPQRQESSTIIAPSKPSPTPTKSWLKIILTSTCIFFLSLSVLFGIFIYLTTESIKPPVPTPQNTTPNAIQPQFSKDKALPKPTEKNPLILSGTMMTGDKWVALINNEIYEVGETVEGKRILDITLEKVELRDGANTLILKVSK